MVGVDCTSADVGTAAVVRTRRVYTAKSEKRRFEPILCGGKKRKPRMENGDTLQKRMKNDVQLS